MKRGTLRSAREGGRLYVLLEHDPTPEPERPHDRTSELITTLREQLDAERQAHAEARRLLAAALEWIPGIEAPESEASLTPTPTEAPGEAEEGVQRTQSGIRRPWWRRILGGE